MQGHTIVCPCNVVIQSTSGDRCLVFLQEGIAQRQVIEESNAIDV